MDGESGIVSNFFIKNIEVNLFNFYIFAVQFRDVALRLRSGQAPSVTRAADSRKGFEI